MFQCACAKNWWFHWFPSAELCRCQPIPNVFEFHLSNNTSFDAAFVCFYTIYIIFFRSSWVIVNVKVNVELKKELATCCEVKFAENSSLDSKYSRLNMLMLYITVQLFAISTSPGSICIYFLSSFLVSLAPRLLLRHSNLLKHKLVYPIFVRWWLRLCLLCRSPKLAFASLLAKVVVVVSCQWCRIFPVDAFQLKHWCV